MNFKAIAAAAALLASATSHAVLVKGIDPSTPSNSEFVLSIFDSAGQTYALDLGVSLATFANGTTSYSWTVGSDLYSAFNGSNSGGIKWAVTGNDSSGAGATPGALSYYTTLTAGNNSAFAFTNGKLGSATTNSSAYEDALTQLPAASSTLLTQTNGDALAAGGTAASFVTSGMNKIGNTSPTGITAGNVIGATGVTFIKLANSSSSTVAAASRNVFTGTFAFDGTTLSYTAAATPAVPEPSTYAMLIAGLAAVGFVARRRAA